MPKTDGKIVIRPERPEDYRAVETLTREAFWNQYVPGCDEHYFAHVLRQSPDFLPELDLVAFYDGTLAGNIMYSRSYVLTQDGEQFPTITFGPLSVLPRLQKKGIGRRLIEHTVGLAKVQGHKAIAIYGDPAYYSRFGFQSGKAFGITNPQGRFPVAHQFLELQPGALHGIVGKAFESDAFQVDPAAAQDFDAQFPPKEKNRTPQQARFQYLQELYLD